LTWEPALAGDGRERIFLAFTERSNKLVVFSDTDPDFEQRVELTQRADAETAPLSVVASTSPALAFANGRLFMAWHDERGLYVMSSPDGESFDTSTLVSFPGYTSYAAPALRYLNGQLYLVTTSADRNTNLFVSSDAGAHFGGPTVLPMQSRGHPALFASDAGGASAPDLLLAWVHTESATATSGDSQIATSPGGTLVGFGRNHVLASDQAEYSVSGTDFKGSSYLAWLGTGDAHHPNVARYSSGELVTYGLVSAE
jgi:hypothetical protein